jgi:DNA-binding transcriptional MerR regulator
MTRVGVPIGVAATRSGVKVPTIRYYEEIGLLTAPPRTKSNRRRYDPARLRRLVFIRHARQLGFEIDAIRPAHHSGQSRSVVRSGRCHRTCQTW